jgi:hypothetical protein
MAEAVCSRPGAAVEADTAPAYPPASPAPAGNISEKFYELKNLDLNYLCFMTQKINFLLKLTF